jgi:hypothetical protein
MKTNHVGESEIVAAVKRGELRVDAAGRVWRCTDRRGNRYCKERASLKPIPEQRAEHRTPQGYLQIRMMIGGTRYHTGAHRVVYMALIGEIPHGWTINHKNGIKDDNRPDNLESVTYSQNSTHAVRVLKVGKAANQDGEQNNRHKLTAPEVADIRAYADYIQREVNTRHGRTISMLAVKYGVAYQTIWDIIKRRTWRS